jgi:L-amino acid N-acyltransferase YncA
MALVRIASPSDAQQLLDIYAPYIYTTAFTFETIAPELNVFAERITKGLIKFPWIVYEIEGSIAGYAYASAHREREAYQWSCETSIYISKAYQGKGIGRVLYKLLLSFLQQQGLVNVYAGISLPNEPSIALHEKMGYKHFATYDNIGFKFGKWQSVGWWCVQVNEHKNNPAVPIPFSRLDASAVEKLFREASAQIKEVYK